MSDIRPAEARDILQDLADSDPEDWDNGYEGVRCHHCKKPLEFSGTHADDCRWLRARRLLGMKP